MTAPLLKPAYPPYITPSELALMLDTAAGGGSKWSTNNVRSTLKGANALVPLPAIGVVAAKSRKPGKGSRWATTYELLQQKLPDLHRALIMAVPGEDA